MTQFSTGRHWSPATVGKWLLVTLLPTFLTDLATTPERRRRPSKLHPTSYLDGLRGLAACSVFAYHYTDYNHKFFLPLYGHNTDDIPSSFLQLPYVRLLYSGTPMVHIFFVISGCALALRPLQYLYNPDSPSQGPSPAGMAKSQSQIASSAFRRPIRLFIPPLAATALAALVVFVLGWMPSFMRPEPTLYNQVADWTYDALNRVMWPWSWDEGSPHSRYNPHLWTIPMEFAHSMFLFLVLLMLSRLRGPHTRQFVLGFLMIYALVMTRWAAFEFLAGAFLADLHLSSHHEASGMTAHLPTHLGEKIERAPSTLKKTIQVAVLLAAGYLLSWPPRKDDMTPSFNWIQSMAPSSYTGPDLKTVEKGKNFWLAVAAFWTVWACGRIRLVQRVLTTPVAQYFGRISFCFYIFQHLILNLMQHHTLGSEYKPATETREEEHPWGVRGTFGISSTLQRTVTWFVGLGIMGAALVCLADFGTRVIDGPAVRLAKRVEALAFGTSSSPSVTAAAAADDTREGGTDDRLEK